jgi:hypothetical protein
VCVLSQRHAAVGHDLTLCFIVTLLLDVRGILGEDEAVEAGILNALAEYNTEELATVDVPGIEGKASYQLSPYTTQFRSRLRGRVREPMATQQNGKMGREAKDDLNNDTRSLTISHDGQL